MYHAEDYQSLNSQGLTFLLKSQGWEWLTVTRFPMVFDRLATTTEHGICRLQELCGSQLATEVITYRARADVSIIKDKYVQLKSSSLYNHALSYRLRKYHYAAELPVIPTMPNFQASKLRLRKFCE